jgi:copper chaperone CopZ
MDKECHVDAVHKSPSIEERREKAEALLAVEGMGCPNCVLRVRNGLLQVYGVVAATSIWVRSGSGDPNLRSCSRNICHVLAAPALRTPTTGHTLSPDVQYSGCDDSPVRSNVDRALRSYLGDRNGESRAVTKRSKKARSVCVYV